MNLFDGSPNTYKMEDICKEKQWERKNKKKKKQCSPLSRTVTTLQCSA